jgi:hypothetical protein
VVDGVQRLQHDAPRLGLAQGAQVLDGVRHSRTACVQRAAARSDLHQTMPAVSTHLASCIQPAAQCGGRRLRQGPRGLPLQHTKCRAHRVPVP